jgi:hypothetical protein
MPFTQDSADGSRVAILRLRSRYVRCTFTLLPMIDGDKAYDEAILRELDRQDLILFDASDSPLAPDDHGGPIPPRMELVTQRATLRDASERDGQSVSSEPSAQEFGRWWQGFPVGGGPHTSVALFRSVVMATSRGPRTIASDLNEKDQTRLRQLVLDALDRSICTTVDRLHEALKDRAIFVAIFLGPRHLEEAASRLKGAHRFRVVEEYRLSVSEQALPSAGASHSLAAPTAIGRRLIEQMIVRRRRTETFQGIGRAIRLGLTIATILGAIGLTYFGILHWSDIRPH